MTHTPALPRPRPGALIRALEAEALDAETATLIADFGQPHWPYWRWLMALLLLAQVALLAQQAAGAGLDQLRPRPARHRPPIVRVLRPGPEPAPANRVIAPSAPGRHAPA